MFTCVVCDKKFVTKSTVRKYMKMHSDKDREFKDEIVKDLMKTKNEFMKRGKKDKGLTLKPSSDNTDADEAFK